MQQKHQLGFTLIEVLISIVLTTVFLVVFIQLSIPIQTNIQKQENDFTGYKQLLFLAGWLDDVVRMSDRVEFISASSSTSTVVSGLAPEKLSEIHFIKTDGTQLVICGILQNHFSCTFPRSSVQNNSIASSTFSFLSILEYGATEIYFSHEENVNQYRLVLGKYILQFGFMPHVYPI